jgi:hypothetical protein
MTKRETVLTNIETILLSVTDLKSVGGDLHPSILDLETAVFPGAFVYGGNDNRLTDDRAVIGYENWEWENEIEVFVRGTDTREDLLGKIHKAMYDDRDIGGAAVTSWRKGVQKFTIDPDNLFFAMMITYAVVYRHTSGTM